MPHAEIGRWDLFIPDGWVARDQGIGISYSEAPDGTKGMYAKTVKPQVAEPSATHLANYVQDAHRRGFEADTQANWIVMSSTSAMEGDLVRSTLDLWDQGSSYRVLSHVLCSDHEAVQVTFHDYMCTDYFASRDQFLQAEESIQLATGAA